MHLNVLPGRVCPTKDIRAIADSATEEYTLISLKPDIRWIYRAEERMVQIARMTGADMVYGDRFINGNEPAPTIDYQSGALRDDFEFGAVTCWRTAALKAAVATMDTDYEYAGFYDLRLRVRQDAIVHIPEFLYYEIETDTRKSGEKLFDYVNPANRGVQIEMEACVTAHLARLGALVKNAKPYEEDHTYPVTASVIIPCRNRVKTIREAVESAVNQHVRDGYSYNVFVVDDNSVDGTVDILRELQKQHDNLIYIPQDKSYHAIGGNWNVAIHDPRCGKYAIQLDSDDIYSGTDTVQRFIDAFESGNYGAVVGTYQLITRSESGEWIPGMVIDHREWTDRNGANNALRINGLGAPRAFRTGLLRQIDFPTTKYGEDYAVMLRIAREYRIGRIYDVLYLCRRWEDNSDANCDIVTMNRNNYYKDKLRTFELMSRKLLLLLLLPLLMVGCVRLNYGELDKRMDVDGGYAIPLGSVRLTLNDLLGNGQISGVYHISADQTDSFLLYYCDTFRIDDKEFHHIDLNKYMLDRNLFVMKMPDRTMPANTTLNLTCDGNLSLSGINQDETTERLDSALIRSARLQFVVTKNAGFTFESKNIKSISVTFDSNFRFTDGGGNTRTVNVSNIPLGDTITLQLKNFYINVMENRHPSSASGYSHNTLDSLRSTLTYTLQSGSSNLVLTGGQLNIKEKLILDSYEALWGFFQGGEDFRGTGAKAIDEMWEGWRKFSKCKLKLTHPSITIQATHHVAAPLMTEIDYIYDKDKVTGDTRYATWNGNSSTTILFNQPGQTLSVTSALHDSVTLEHMFNQEASNGRMDNLFTVKPDSLYYSFRVKVDQNRTATYPQMRITDDRYVHTRAILNMPFRFNPEADVEYRDTIRDVHITKYSLDSLIATQEWVDTLREAHVKMVMVVQNYLPFRTRGTFRFLDAAGKDVPLYLTPDSTNTLEFPAPPSTAFGGQSGEEIRPDAIVDPTVVVLDLDKQESEILTRIKNIEYTIRGNDNPVPCRLSTKNTLRIQVGVGLKVNGTINGDKL